MAENGGLMHSIVFSSGTGMPVILFSIVIAYSISKLGMYYKAIQKVEKLMGIIASVVFIIIGLYYVNISNTNIFGEHQLKKYLKKLLYR